MCWCLCWRTGRRRMETSRFSSFSRLCEHILPDRGVLGDDSESVNAALDLLSLVQVPLELSRRAQVSVQSYVSTYFLLYWVQRVFGGDILVLGIPVTRESYFATLLRRDQQKSSRQKRQPLVVMYPELFARVRTALALPIRLLLQRPILLVHSIMGSNSASPHFASPSTLFSSLPHTLHHQLKLEDNVSYR